MHEERNSSAIRFCCQDKFREVEASESERTTEHHLAHERVLNRRDAIEEGESTPAQPAQRQALVRKQMNKRIRECDAACAVAATARGKRCQNFACTRIAAVRLYTFGQLPRVTQPKVEALAGDWMQSLRGISH